MLGRDIADAENQLSQALARARAAWELDSTARNLRLIREVESGLDARLERELTNQRQAERIDRRDGNVAEPLAQLLPFRGRQL